MFGPPSLSEHVIIGYGPNTWFRPGGINELCAITIIPMVDKIIKEKSIRYLLSICFHREHAVKNISIVDWLLS